MWIFRSCVLLALLLGAVSGFAQSTPFRLDVPLRDSPAPDAWDFDTWEEHKWFGFRVSGGDLIDTVTLTFNWSVDDYPEESTIWLQTPDEDPVVVGKGLPSGTYSIAAPLVPSSTTDGNWFVWLTDNYGDGGHQLTSGTVTLQGRYVTDGVEFVVTTPEDSLAEDGQLSLREAIIAANENRSVDGSPEGGRYDRIVLPPGRLTLSIPGRDEDLARTGDLDLLSDMDIIGAPDGSTVIDAQGIDRVFDLAWNRAADIVGVTITGGDVTLPGTSDKIVNGRDAEPGEFPSVVALFLKVPGTPYNSTTVFCGGTLISPEWVLTAAHCVYMTAPKDIAVGLGKLDLDADEPASEVVDVIEIVIFDDFDPTTLDSDIALVRLARPVYFPTSPVIPQADPEGIAAEGALATAVGWGRLFSGGPIPSHLQAVDLPIVSFSRAAAAFDALYNRQGSLTPNMLVAGFFDGTADACKGDSGGPLFVNGMLNGEPTRFVAGLTSWGVDCAQPGYPGVYTRVANFSDWTRNMVEFSPPAKVNAGGAIHTEGYLALVNCVVARNRAAVGGAINSRDGLALLHSTTIADNVADRASALFVGNLAVAANCNIWRNSGNAIVEGFGAFSSRASNIQGLEGEFGPAVDPLFVDADAGDYSLSAESPIRDRGSWRALQPDFYDLDGDSDTTESLPLDITGAPRDQGAQVDPGAYEFAAPAVPGRDRDRDGIPDSDEIASGMNPESRDTDEDGFEDGLELRLGTDPFDDSVPGDPDADGDGMPDSLDPNPSMVDTDGDGWSDGFEAAFGFDPADAGSTPPLGDLNGDGRSDNADAVRLLEELLGTAPAHDHASTDVNRDDVTSRADFLRIMDGMLGYRPVYPNR